MNGDLLQNICNYLRTMSVNSPILTNPPASEKLYEIFILICVIRALKIINVSNIQVRDSNDVASNNLIFRLGPGRIYSPSSSPGFIFFVYKNNEYEIQNGLRVKGHSNVLHELDVCIIDRKEATRCRTKNIDPTRGIKFFAECKFYGTILPLHLGREYLGLSSEFSCRVKTIISNSSSDEILRLVTKHKGTINFDVSTSTSQNVTTFINWLANELKQVL